MSGFPKLIPAFTAQIPITPPSTVGSPRSGGLFHVAFVPDSGSLRSEPGYAVQLDAVFVHGSDFIRADRAGDRVRLEVASLVRDKTSGGFLRFDYAGTLPTTGPAGLVLGGKPEAETTEFGEIFTHVTFESDDPNFRVLAEKVYVGSGRFILEKDQPVVVEYKISEVTS